MARIALDIDSTLHHYWDLLEGIAQDRYGVALPYAEQRDWGITQLEREQLVACVTETHSDENIEGAVPYEGAVEAVTRWHEAGHFIHVTSHRREECAPATRRWLEATGLPLRRPALQLRQAHPLRGAGDRRAGGRQPGEHRRRA